VGSYPKKKEAESLAKTLRDKGYNAYVAETKLKEKTWHQVRVGGFASRGEANNLQDKLRAKEDLKQSFIVNVQ
jgi:cell division septation protein DedD